MSIKIPKKFFITRLEPAKYRDELYGKQIEFDGKKQDIIFQSEFHSPGILHFDQVENILLEFDRKRKLLWWALATFFLGVGVFLFIIRVRLLPWKVHIFVKNQEKPIKIRAWMNEEDIRYFHPFLTKHFSIKYIPQPEKKHSNRPTTKDFL